MRIVVFRRHALGIGPGAADDDIVADFRLGNQHRHDVAVVVQAHRVAAFAAAPHDAERFQPGRRLGVILAGEQCAVLAHDGNGMLGAVQQRTGQQLHAAVDDQEVQLVGQLLVDDPGDDMARIGHHEGSRLDFHLQFASGGLLELRYPLRGIAAQRGDVGLLFTRHAGDLESAAKADGGGIREIGLHKTQFTVDVLAPFFRVAPGPDMDMDLGEAQPQLVSHGLYRGDIVQMHAEAGIFAAGIAGGAFTAAGCSRMDPHGEVDAVGFGKICNQLKLGHGADVVLEAGLDHLLQFGTLLTGRYLLGGQHHTRIGYAGGMGASRFIQRRAIQVQPLVGDNPQHGSIRVGLHGVAYMQAKGIGHVQQLFTAVFDVFLIMQIYRCSPLPGYFRDERRVQFGRTKEFHCHSFNLTKLI